MLSEALDEKFARLEEKLSKEFADIKWLLYSILEQQPNYLKSVRYANLHEAFDDYLSLRQDEIDEFNNTMQNLSVLNGWCQSLRSNRAMLLCALLVIQAYAALCFVLCGCKNIMLFVIHRNFLNNF